MYMYEHRERLVLIIHDRDDGSDDDLPAVYHYRLVPKPVCGCCVVK